MILKHFFLPAVSLGLCSLGSASVYVSDFSGASVGDPLEGVDGWGQSEPNPAVNQPLAWISTLGSSNAGTVGAYYEVPSGALFYADRPINTPFAGSTLSLQFALQDSTTDFAFRNQFGFTIANGSGANLFSLEFTPQSQLGLYDDALNPNDPLTSDAMWNVGVTSTGLGAVPSFAAVGEDALYTLGLTFTQNGADIDYSLTLQGEVGGAVLDNGTLTGLSAETFADLRVTFQQGSGADWGDNFIAFRAVPEPSVMALAALAGLGFLRRRR